MLYLLSALPEKRRKPTELPTEIIMSLLLSVYTDRQYPSEIRSVYTDKICSSVYTDRIADGLYSFFEKLQRCDEVDFFFSDSFTDGMTEGFKPGSPYSDAAQSPADSPAGIPTERVRR